MGVTYDKLRAAGIDYGLKPANATGALQPLLDSGISELSACILQAWLGGAHDGYDTGVSFQAFGEFWGDEGFGATSSKLSAQYYCKDKDTFFAKLLGHDSVSYCLDELRQIDDKAAELVESAGNAKAKASAEKQDVEAEADAEKLRNQALSAVSVGAIGIGTVVAVAVVAYLVFMAQAAKRG
jgi:hypothetical protein